jgi:uncharacterized paraquat-inducible protein A
MATKYDRIDVWFCEECDREWRVPSVPHNPKCPRCGTGGWWKRFEAPPNARVDRVTGLPLNN